MPVHEIALPVGAKNIDPQLPVVLRSSKDGNIPVVQLFSGDKFVGEVLEGQWVKGDDGVIVGPYTAIITSGQLELTGKAAVAANDDYGWLNGKVPFLMVQNSYIDVHMKVPTVTPANEIKLSFLLRMDSAVDTPLGDDDYILLQMRRTTAGLTRIFIEKSILNTTTTLYAVATVTNNEGTFRIKFRPTDDKLDIYFHDGSGDVAEGTDELTLITDTLDLNFDIGYPAYVLTTADTTVRTLISDMVSVSYPDTGISYDQDVTDLGKGDVKCYDTMGEASEALWMRVYSEGHDFTGDCVIENGLIRLFVDEGASLGLRLYYWTGSVWSQPLDTLVFRQETDAKALTYPFLKSVVQMDRAESIQLRVRVCDSATESDDYNAEVLLTLARGKYHLSTVIESVIPSQPIRLYFGDSTALRWSFCGDVPTKGIGDTDFPFSVTNTTMTDNFMIEFDDDVLGAVGFIVTNQKPSVGGNAFYSYQGEYSALYSISPTDFSLTEIGLGVIPFAGVTSTFEEAETCTQSSGTLEVVDALASGGYMVELDTQNEWVHKFIDVPVGRYLAIVRIKDTAQVTDDVQYYVRNSTDGRYLNDGGQYNYMTVTASYAYYQLVLDFTSDDSSDTVFIHIQKATTTTNTIKVDCFHLIPITDGASLIQDIAHNEMRTLDQGFRLTDTATFEIFAGLGFSYGGTLGSAYTDAMAVAAVEAEPTLDLTGVLTAKRFKNQLDNEGFFTGAGDDLRLYHDGTDSYIVNSQGNLVLQNVGGNIQLETQDFFLDSTGKVQIRDKDDTDAVLWELDSTARTLKIGTAADSIATTFSGNINAQAYYTDMGEITVPANPAANVRRIFVSSVTNELSVRTNAGTTVSLEGGGGGPGTGTQWTLPVWNTTTTLGDSMLTQDSGGTALTIGGSTTINTIVAGVTDYDKFLVSHAGLIKFRTGAEVLGDIGAAAIIHNLIDITNHPVSGLTAGHFLKATSPTAYAFQLHGLVAGDVGAYTSGETDAAIDADISTHNVANRHIDHSGVSITAGTGLSGGGTIAATRTINCDITQYTNALAVAAVVAENPLTLTNSLVVTGGVTDCISYRADSNIQFKTLANAAQYGQFKGLTLSSSYADAPVADGIRFGADVTLFRHAVNKLKTDDNFIVDLDLTINGGDIRSSSDTPAISFDASGNITKIGQSTHTQSHYLQWDGSKAVWAAGGGGGPGTGTQWTIPVWNTTTTLGDSMIAQNSGGTLATVSGALTVSGAFKAGGDGFDIDASGNVTDITVAAATVDTDKFLVQDGSQIKYRTGIQLLSDIVTPTSAQLDALTMFGTTNAAYIATEPVFGANRQFNTSWTIENIDGTDIYWYFYLLVPTNKMGLKLFIRGWEMGLQDADLNDYVDEVVVQGLTHTSASVVNQKVYDYDSVGRKAWPFTAVDCSGYYRVQGRIHANVTTGGELAIAYFNLLCYYGT